MTDLTPAELAPALRREGLDAQASESTYEDWVWLEGADDLDCLLEPSYPGAYLLRDGVGERRALEELARALSSALTLMGIRHRMELYDEDRHMVDYLHHDWPLVAAPACRRSTLSPAVRFAIFFGVLFALKLALPYTGLPAAAQVFALVGTATMLVWRFWWACGESRRGGILLFAILWIAAIVKVYVQQ